MWKSGMICEVCSKTEEIQLHHVDGQWWNYQLENLQFLCRTCHLAAHGGCWKNLKNGVVSMTWNSAKLEIMRERATAICQSEFGLSIEQAVLEKKMSAVCRVLADESETLFGRSSKWNSLYDVLKKHILSATERSTQPNDDNTVTVAPKTVTKMLNRRSVSIEDAIRIGRTIEAFEKFGITISFN
jgi:plasmid maintenance system antidote protein VapI